MELQELKIKLNEGNELILSPNQARELKKILDDLFEPGGTHFNPIIIERYREYYPLRYWEYPVVTWSGTSNATITLSATN